MTELEIAIQRLYNQHLTGEYFKKPDEVVQWLGAVQAQDYAAAKWAVAQRTESATGAEIDQALAGGTIVRTHIMRPTWHFVSPDDIRWMLELTAPRINALNAYYYRKNELDETVFARSQAVLAKALQGGKWLTRTELASILQQAGIIKESDDSLRFIYLLMRAELDMVICSGPRQGKQFTYALFEERVPKAKVRDREEALAEFARRFFTGHGPATLRDFTLWSGLAATEAKAGLEMAKPDLSYTEIENKIYWFGQDASTTLEAPPLVRLIPAYDEYLIAYHDYNRATLSFDPKYGKQVSDSAAQTILLDGRVVGVWKRTFKKDRVVMTLSYFEKLTLAQIEAVSAVASQYGRFMNMSVTLTGDQ